LKKISLSKKKKVDIITLNEIKIKTLSKCKSLMVVIKDRLDELAEKTD
jgi:hypothetical protein